MKTTVKTPRNRIEEKKQVNIAWNSRLFFQIGIIVSCLIVFFVMQASFEIGSPVYAERPSFGLEEPPMINYRLDVEKPEPNVSIAKEPVKPRTIPRHVKSRNFIVKANTSDEVETPTLPTDTPFIESSNTEELHPKGPEPTATESTGPSSILNVEFVPVYPGCEGFGSNAEKIDCLSSQINSFINRNFRKELLENLERDQIQKIYVQFKIDSQGFITDVRANSTNEKLKNEAMRVVAKLPKMKPGRQGDKNMDVLYTVPIVFRIQ